MNPFIYIVLIAAYLWGLFVYIEGGLNVFEKELKKWPLVFLFVVGGLALIWPLVMLIHFLVKAVDTNE